MTSVNWMYEPHPLDCRVCGFSGTGTLIAEVTALAEVDMPLVRCPDCGSVQMREVARDSSPTYESVDDYIEAGVGIGAIAEALSLADLSAVRSFLDVGCNYGFALDLGRFLFDWRVLGVEPSMSGARGAAELGLDIRNEYLTIDSEIGDNFDLILASEVLEHVPDPLGFLQAIAARLSATGQVVLTTPAADYLDAANPESEVLAAVSAGYHVFLASESGLGQLLQRAGFRGVRVDRVRGSLRAVAGLTEQLAPATHPISALDLERYYENASRSAPDGSAMSTGMAVRLLRSRVARGDLGDIDPVVELVSGVLATRTGQDLDEPAALAEHLRAGAATPWILAGAAFAIGMIELSTRERPERAADYFALSSAAALSWREAAVVADLDTVDLIFQSAYHRSLALARFDPESAIEQILVLGEYLEPAHPDRASVLAARECRVYAEIAVRGSSARGTELERRVATSAAHLADSADPEQRSAALDGLLCLALSYAQAGDPQAARTLLDEVHDLAMRSGGAHGEAVAVSARDQSALLAAIVADVPVPDIHSFIDTYWCDAYGTYVDGWAHLENVDVTAVSVSVGSRTVIATRRERQDLIGFWPEAPAVAAGGFAAYVPGPPAGAIVLRLDTAEGYRRTTITLPAHPLPVVPQPPQTRLILEESLALAPDGPVLTIGLRAPTAEVAETELARFGSRAVTSLDIHDGHGVTIVGDAHQMSSFLPGDFALVTSSDVLEHLSAPWVFARECARVMRPGGIAMHLAPWVWPTHAEPNDFYRYSPEGLAQLFGPELGFRVVASGATDGVRILPSQHWRASALRMPTTESGSHSWIIVEKVSDVAAGVEWPYSGETTARSYPLDGLAPRNAGTS